MPIVFWASLEPCAKAMKPGGEDLQLAEHGGQRLAGEALEDPDQRDHQHERDGEAEERAR